MGAVELNHIYTYPDIIRKCIHLSGIYSEFLSLESIGKSCDGREIVMLRLGENKKYLVVIAGVHGREYINSSVLLRVMEEYCNRIAGNGLELFKEYGVLYIPVLNPDGYSIAMEGFSAIEDKFLRKYCKSQNINSAFWKWNARAVDINRNFMSESFSKSMHSGDMNSEDETKAFVNMIQYENTIGLLDFHSRGNTIYYYRKNMDKKYNEYQKKLANCIANSTGYEMERPENEIEEGDTGGNTVHYYSEFLKKPAITIETVPETENFPLTYEIQYHVLYRIRNCIYETIRFISSEKTPTSIGGEYE